MKISRTLLPLALALALLPACRVVGPNYRRPSVPGAPAYKEQPPTAFKEVEGWKQSNPRDEMSRGEWWQMFGDTRLNDLELRAMVANQNVRQSEAAFRQARAAIRINRSALFPTLSTNPGASVSQNTGSASKSTAARGVATFLSLPFDVSWEPDLWGRVRRTVENAVGTAQASAADLENVRLTIQSEVAIDYFQLRTLDATAQLLENTVAAYEKALQLTTNRFNGGIASQVDVTQALTQVETTRAQLIDIGVARAQFEHAIAALIGDPASTFSIPRLPLDGLPPAVPPGVPSELLERRPDIAFSERRVAAANAQIGVAQAAYYPTLSLSAVLGLQGSFTSFFTGPARLWSVGPGLAQTLFDAGRRHGVTDQAIAAYDQTVAAYRQSVLTAFQEVEDNLSTLRLLEQEAERESAAVASAEKSLALSLDRYRAGVTTYLEVITAQAVALSNERTAVSLLGRRMVADVQLVKALGGGWNAAKLPTEQQLR